MRGVRFTKAECQYITASIGDDPDDKLGRSIKQKIYAAQEAPAGVNPGPIEDALIGPSRNKVVKLVGGWARASRACQQAGATAEDAAVIGEWIARQGWLKGPQTLLDVLNKWPQWLAKARATQPQPALREGLEDTSADQSGRVHDGVAGQEPGQGPSQSRQPKGFR